MRKLFKNEIGITLIALVITIIVLLILAGVTITTLTGENGILERARTAKETTDSATEEEKYKLGQYENEIDNYTMNRGSTITVDEATLDKMIEDKINEKIYSSTIFHGTIKTNTMGASDTSVKVNEFTVAEEGNYIINFIGALRWNTNSVFGLYINKNGNRNNWKYVFK